VVVGLAGDLTENRARFDKRGYDHGWYANAVAIKAKHLTIFEWCRLRRNRRTDVIINPAVFVIGND
jgi:hypothetical protein